MIENLISASIVEEAINAALKLDPQATEKLNELDGVKISIQLDFSPQPWTFTVESSRLCLIAIAPADCDVRLSGTLSGFLHAFRGRGEPGTTDKLYIEGDLHSAQKFQRVMADLEPDFDFVLRKRFGEKLGGLVTGVLNQVRLQGKQASEKAEGALRDWLFGENGQFVNKEELEVLRQSITNLTAQVNRLETRLAQLEKH